MIEIAVVIPTFNRAPLLARALDSVLNQTLPPQQVIVVDDGSTDHTSEIASRYQGRIEFVRQDNGGASAARNRGIELARGGWIAFLDSDDYWKPGHLAALEAAIAATDSRAVVYFDDMQMPDTTATLWEGIGFQPRRPWQLVDDASAWALMKRQPMMLQTSAIRKDALQRVGGLDPRFRLVHDSHLFCLLGIGAAACAVGAVGCIQTSDDATTARLTTAIPLNSQGKTAEDFLMWTDILERNCPVPEPLRRLVLCNAAGSCWSIGRDLLRSGHYVQGVLTIIRALALDTRFAFWMLRHGTQRGYDYAVRPKCAEVASDSTNPYRDQVC